MDSASQIMRIWRKKIRSLSLKLSKIAHFNYFDNLPITTFFFQRYFFDHQGRFSNLGDIGKNSSQVVSRQVEGSYAGWFFSNQSKMNFPGHQAPPYKLEKLFQELQGRTEVDCQGKVDGNRQGKNVPTRISFKRNFWENFFYFRNS